MALYPFRPEDKHGPDSDEFNPYMIGDDDKYKASLAKDLGKDELDEEDFPSLFRRRRDTREEPDIATDLREKLLK